MSAPKMFGRVRQGNTFFSLFECDCGCREWITENVETTRKFSCQNCGETYILIKKPDKFYGILRPNQKD